MAKKNAAKSAADFIENLNMNGLEGRMLYMPAPANKKRNILLVYGHHSKLEWWHNLAKQLNRYGSVTAPDLPGFGGMEPLRKIKERPTLNNWADYLAAFIKLRYKKRSQITVVGAGFGFAVATRMLQRYPNIAKNVDMVVSLNGFTHGDDIKISATERRKIMIKRLRLAAPLSKQIFYGKNSLANVYANTRSLNKYRLENLLFFKVPLQDDIDFWRTNDAGSHKSALANMFKLDNCIKKINLPVWHVAASSGFLDRHNLEQHMRVVFSEFYETKPRTSKKASPATELLPMKLRRELAKDPKSG